jgi:predicted DCC family thiol-disulfide oxidoreductase YuxK
MAEPRDLLLYDGVCVACNWFTRFVVARDGARRFRFAPLQSDVARAVLARHGREARDLDTVYVVADEGTPGERVLAKSDAGLHVLARLGWPWRASALLRLLPARLRDRLYDAAIRHRYRLFGQYESCPLPAPGAEERFLGLPGSQTTAADDRSSRKSAASPDTSCPPAGARLKPPA